MDPMKHSHFIHKLSKLLVYILGRQPDEFGLFTDEKGYVKIKDLMKALAEESGWRHVRLDHIREAVYTTRSPAIEIDDNRIRARDRSRLPLPEIAKRLPTLLYYPVRRRAHPVILEKGLPSANAKNRIVLVDDMALAKRLGRRIDPSPVILTVHSDKACENGATIWRFGNQLFLSDCLPLGSLSGPPLPKHKPDSMKIKTAEPQPPSKTPGSYLLDLTITPTAKNRSRKESRQHKDDWKRARKQKIRNKGFRSPLGKTH